MSGCPTSVARTYHRDETWDCLRVRTYGNRALEVLVSVTPHQGRREGRLQGEAAQGYALAGARATLESHVTRKRSCVVRERAAGKGS